MRGRVDFVFKSTDGGENWRLVDTGLVADGDVRALAIDPVTPSTLYAGIWTNAYGVFKSTNGGGSWSPPPTPKEVEYVRALAIDPRTPSTLYAGSTDLGLLKSTDGGGRWTKVNSGLPTFPSIHAVAIDPLTPSTVYAAPFGSGVFKSTNGGGTWSAVNSGLPFQPHIEALAIDPLTPTTLYAGDSDDGVFKSTNGGSSWSAFNSGLTDRFVSSLAIDPLTPSKLYAGSGRGVFAIQFTPAPPAVALAAAILPGSRSVQVGIPATAFVTVINAGTTTASQVGISLTSVIPAAFQYRTTDPTTNQVTGTLNTPVDIPAGGLQTYVVGVSPTGPFGPTDVAFNFGGSNTAPVGTLTGINTLLLSASATPVPDIVALAATLNNDGIVNIPGPRGTGIFAVATVNMGASSSITATADTGTSTPPVTIALCQTNPTTGGCLGSPADTVTTQINANATPTFGLFVTGAGLVPFDPASSRIFVRFKDGAGVTRGATSVAVRTQ